MGLAKELDIRHYIPTPKTNFFVSASPLKDAIIEVFVNLLQ
jgi:hypothetical protein